MGKEAIKVSTVDQKELLKMLNSALSEEWMAYYQYWIGARVMQGPMRSEVEAELLLHADEELSHALLLVNRIIQLRGTPVLSPLRWAELAGCAYQEPKDLYIERILEQNLRSERCAIDSYQKLADYTMGKDHVTYQMIVTILNQEMEHENDLEDWITDLKLIK